MVMEIVYTGEEAKTETLLGDLHKQTRARMYAHFTGNRMDLAGERKAGEGALEVRSFHSFTEPKDSTPEAVVRIEYREIPAGLELVCGHNMTVPPKIRRKLAWIFHEDLPSIYKQRWQVCQCQEKQKVRFRAAGYDLLVTLLLIP